MVNQENADRKGNASPHSYVLNACILSLMVCVRQSNSLFNDVFKRGFALKTGQTRIEAN